MVNQSRMLIILTKSKVMFKKGDILVNKKKPTLVVLIETENGTATILESSSKKNIGTNMVCKNPAFYEKIDPESEEKYLSLKIKHIYKCQKNIKIQKYI